MESLQSRDGGMLVYMCFCNAGVFISLQEVCPQYSGDRQEDREFKSYVSYRV